MRFSRSLGATVLACSALLFAPARLALATPLGVGGLLFPTPAEPDPTGGVVVAGGIPVPFAAGAFSGTLTTTVIAGDPSNALGGLTFVYQLSNDITSTNVLERLTVNGYAPFLVDASYQAPAAGILPAFVDRQTADVVGFSFIVPLGPSVLVPGSSSALLVLQTNAPAFVPSFASVIDGTVASVASYSPVPEPGSLGAMGVAVVLLARRRR